MYNISKLEEARALLSKESLLPDDVRELLLYFVQRDDEIRQDFKKHETVHIALLRSSRALLLGLMKVRSPMDSEMQQELLDAVRAYDDVIAILVPPDLLQ